MLAATSTNHPHHLAARAPTDPSGSTAAGRPEGNNAPPFTISLESVPQSDRGHDEQQSHQLHYAQSLEVGEGHHHAAGHNQVFKNNNRADASAHARMATNVYRSNEEFTSSVSSLWESFSDSRLLLREPTNHRPIDPTTLRLNKRLSELWGNSNIYKAICSERFGDTISDLFFYNCRQIAQVVRSHFWLE